MSGGVDSSVAAVSLHRAGHDVLGVYLRMRNVSAKAEATSCVNPQHEEDARTVAQLAGIPFQVIDMRDAFEIEIVQPFMQSYLRGETPNPCVLCNVKVKLGPLIQWAIEHGYDKVCTGHYARILQNETGSWELRRGVDPLKDQSYYLCGLSQSHLARLVLPRGEMVKADTRKLAAEWGLPVAQKADSQDICISADEGDYRQYMSARLDPDSLLSEGPIVNVGGEVIGRHSGLHQFTIGQRRGLGISHSKPLYVVGIHTDSNTLVVGEEESLYQQSMEVESFNWTSENPPPAGSTISALAQIRYQHKASPATAHIHSTSELSIEFAEPQRAIAPGQVAALYDGDLVLGGGIIKRRHVEDR